MAAIWSRRRRQGGVFRNRSFMVLWLGLLVSSIGDWIQYVAMVSLVYTQTHSALSLALLRLFHIIPILVFAPFAGVLVDRWHRKRTLVIAPAIGGIAVGVLAFYHPLPLVFVAYLAITVTFMFFDPALMAAVPQIEASEDLVAANSFSEITGTSSIVLGGAIGGLLVGRFGPGAAFVFDAVSFLLISALVGCISVPDRRLTVTARSIRRELVEGLIYLRDQSTVARVVGAGALFIFASASLLTLGVAFVHTAFGGNASAYGIMLAGMGVGSLVGAIGMSIYRGHGREDRAFALSGIALGVAVAGLGVSRSLPLATLMYGVAGLAAMVNTVSAVTLLQRVVPQQFLGRIFALASTVDHLGAFVSTALIGVATGVLDAPRLITLSGGIAAGTGLVSLTISRRYNS